MERWRRMSALVWAWWAIVDPAALTGPGPVFLDEAGGQVCGWTWGRMRARTGQVWRRVAQG